MSGLPAASRRWLAAVEALDLHLDVREIPAGTKTAEDAAAGVGCDVRHIVKSLVFVVDGRPVVALVPGDRRLDPDLLATAMGGTEAGRADLDTVRSTTGFAAGGTPPFGHATRVPVVADAALEDATLWIAAGTPTTVAAIGLGDLLAATGARVAPLSHPG
ncbi:MAG: YbaK/EbsC family protein [Acidimicrobiia bacterium]